MSIELKKLVGELDTLFAKRCELLDAPARDELQASIDSLKKAVEHADAESNRRLMNDAMNLLAAVLSLVTNVMPLLK